MGKERQETQLGAVESELVRWRAAAIRWRTRAQKAVREEYYWFSRFHHEKACDAFRAAVKAHGGDSRQARARRIELDEWARVHEKAKARLAEHGEKPRGEEGGAP